VYTGNGKGKTTAAVGQAARAAGHNRNVLFMFFNKKPNISGEENSLKKIGVTVEYFSSQYPVNKRKKKLKERVSIQTRKGIEFVLKAFHSGNYDYIIMDEILVSVRDKYLKEEELLKLIDEKPENTELLLTGRGATESVIANADIVSKVVNVKHPYKKGDKCKKATEY